MKRISSTLRDMVWNQRKLKRFWITIPCSCIRQTTSTWLTARLTMDAIYWWCSSANLVPTSPGLRRVISRQVRSNNIEGGVSTMPELPKFSSDQEAAAWFASHDTTPYIDSLTPVTEPIPVVRSRPTKQPVGLRIRKDYLEAVKQV